MSEYPEHDKLKAVRDQSHACGAFVEWLREEKGIALASRHEHDASCEGEDGYRICGVQKGELLTSTAPLQRLLGEFFEIDEERLEQEKRKMLDEMRAAQGG